MGEKDTIPEAIPIALDEGVEGDASQVAPVSVLLLEDERDEGRPGGYDVQAELRRQAKAQVGGADLGIGQPTGRDDQRVGLTDAEGGLNRKVTGLRDPEDIAVDQDLRVGTGAFLEEHPRNLAGVALAEELAGLSFVVGDAVPFNQGDKVQRGETSQDGFTEMRILGDVVPGRDM